MSITEVEKEGRSKMIASCSYLEKKFRHAVKKRSGSFDKRRKVRSGPEDENEQLGAKEKARRKSDVMSSFAKGNRAFHRNNRRIDVRKLLRMGLVFARVRRGHAVGIAPPERLRLRRQMAAAGKKESVSLSVFMEVNNLEVDEG